MSRRNISFILSIISISLLTLVLIDNTINFSLEYLKKLRKSEEKVMRNIPPGFSDEKVLAVVEEIPPGLTRPGEIPLFLSGKSTNRASPNFLLRNEKARQNFLEKRDKEIIRGRDPNTIPSAEGALPAWHFIWNAFPPSYTCPHGIDRVGTLNDGGKWICGFDVFKESREPCIVYSLGIGYDSSFELEFLQKTNCHVYAFDHTKKKLVLPKNVEAEYAQRVHFKKVGVTSRPLENDTLKSLGNLMRENGHTWIDFLKMDIEKSEFDVLPDVIEEFGKFPFGHFNLEVHAEKNYRNDTIGKVYNLFNLVESKGLRPFYWEMNYAMVTFGYLGCIEYAFINVVDERNRLLHF